MPALLPSRVLNVNFEFVVSMKEWLFLVGPFFELQTSTWLTVIKLEQLREIQTMKFLEFSTQTSSEIGFAISKKTFGTK